MILVCIKRDIVKKKKRVDSPVLNDVRPRIDRVLMSVLEASEGTENPCHMSYNQRSRFVL